MWGNQQVGQGVLGVQHKDAVVQVEAVGSFVLDVFILERAILDRHCDCF